MGAEAAADEENVEREMYHTSRNRERLFQSGSVPDPFLWWLGEAVRCRRFETACRGGRKRTQKQEDQQGDRGSATGLWQSRGMVAMRCHLAPAMLGRTRQPGFDH
jgi:hypothetical protein